MSPYKSLSAVLMLLPLIMAGCAGVNPLFSTKPAHAMATQKNPASQVIAMWRPTRGTFDGRPTRGFAGQIMFFTDQNSPVVVNGKIRIYLFDDQGTLEEQSKPIRQFDFDAPSWNSYAKLSKVGPAYNIFIPYTRAGKHEANCTLSLRFIADDESGGHTLFSEEALVTLEGTRSNKHDVVRLSRDKPAQDAEPIKQSFDLSYERIVPEKVAVASRKNHKSRNSIQRAVAEKLESASREIETQRVSYEEVDADEDRDIKEFFDDTVRDQRRTARSKRRRTTNRRAESKHPLSEQSDRDEEFEIERDAEDVDEFDAVIRKQDSRRSVRRRHTNRHPSDSEDEAITVDMSRLYETTAEDEESEPQRRTTSRPTRRKHHPLEELTEDEIFDETAEFAESEAEQRIFAVPLNR